VEYPSVKRKGAKQMLLLSGVVFLISGLLLGTSRQDAAGDRQNRNIIRGLGLAFLTVGMFSAGSWFIPLAIDAMDKNVAQLGAWVIMVPPMVLFLAVLTSARKPL
jgi:hypothetical protein